MFAAARRPVAEDSERESDGDGRLHLIEPESGGVTVPPRAGRNGAAGRAREPRGYPSFMSTGGAVRGIAGNGEPWEELAPSFTWSDLALPEPEIERLRAIPGELATRARGPADRRGLTVLFTGGPGTGKTMAARTLAAELGTHVLELDLVGAVSNDDCGAGELVERVFAAGERSGAVLFFDGAGAFLGAARDGRAPELDLTELSERASRYPGVVVFASSAKRTLDQDLNLFDLSVDFPFPEPDARRKIWRAKLGPSELVDDGDIELLASAFRLDGAAIEHCSAVAAGMAAAADEPLSQRHIAAALEKHFRTWVIGAATREALDTLRARAAVASPPATSPSRLVPPAAPAVAAVPAPPAEPPRAPEPVVQSAPAAAPAREAATKSLPRPAPARPRERDRRRSRSSRLVLPIVAILVAAGLGLGLANAFKGSSSGSSTALTRHASAGPLSVSFLTGWRLLSKSPRSPFKLGDELAFSPAGHAGTLLIGVTSTSDWRLLPTKVLAGLPRTITPQTATLGALHFYRYSLSGPAIVYALPTSAGTVIGDCMTARATRQFAGNCARVLATIRLASGSVLGSGVSMTYAAALNKVITTLNGARAGAGTQLHAARTAAAAASAAGALAAAHAAAANAISHLNAGPASAANANKSLARALSSLAGDYNALANAARTGNSGAYASALASLRPANAALSAALAQLAALGYRVG